MGELVGDTLVIADGICGSVDFDVLLDIFNGAATIPDWMGGIEDFVAFGKLLRDCIGLVATFDGAFLAWTLVRG